MIKPEIINNCTLYNGDCLKVMPTLPIVDMVLTDPPYGTTACKWDSIIPLDKMWQCLQPIVKPNGAMVFTASQPFTSTLVLSNIKRFKHEWVWKKNAGSNFGAVRYQPMKEHESVLVFGVKSPKYNPQMQNRADAGKKMIKSGVKSKASKGLDVYAGLNAGYDNSKQNPFFRYPSSVQNFNRERGLHPTQKPVALMKYLIKTYTNEGDTVLDFTMGSGTTGVACINTGRKFIGIELDKDYFEIACDRIKAAYDAID